MVTQCEAESKKKKKNSINLYAGIFDSKSFGRGGARGHSSACRPHFERPSSDDPPPPPPTPPGRYHPPQVGTNCLKSFSEDVQRDNHAAGGCDKDYLMQPGKITVLRSSQPHFGLYHTNSGSRKDSNRDDVEVKATFDLDTEELEKRNSQMNVIGEHVNAIDSLSVQFGVDARKRSLEDDVRLAKMDYRSSQRSAGHECHENRVVLWGKDSKSSEGKNLPEDRPSLPRKIMQRNAESSDDAATDVDHCSVPSALPGKQCTEGANVKRMVNLCGSTSVPLQLGKTPNSSTIRAAEMLNARSSASVDELCRVEGGLGDESASTGYEDVRVSLSFSCRERSHVDAIATAMVPGSQCDIVNGRLNSGNLKETEWADYPSPDRNLISKEKKGIPCSNGHVDTLKSEVTMNCRHHKESSKAQASSYMSLPRASKSGEQEPYGRSADANRLAWKGSPCRGHGLLVSSPARIGETISLDSLSSHGGSSSSGSPLACEALKEGRASSPRDILVRKGSPYSMSSRSMGSVTGYDNAVNGLLSPTSSNEGSGRYYQWSMRRSEEMMVGGVRSSHGNLRGSSDGSSHSMMKADGTSSSFSARGNLCANGNGHSNPLNSGSLLVGGANGNVLSYSGVTVKGNARQENMRQGTLPVDCRLLKRALATSDPEEIKNAGNEYLKAGHFSEALTLYDKAVALSPRCVVYRSNRAAALSGLERLGEAVKECEEAIELDPSCCCARRHAASLYIRLGMVESAKQHLCATGQHKDIVEGQRLQIVERHLSRCIEARKSGDWHNVVKESDAAVVAGADSAPQIFGFKAEALLQLQMLQQANKVCNVARRIENSLMNLSIGSPNPYLHLTSVQVNLALGRFDEAVQAAEEGARIEPNNAVVAAVLRKAQTVANARASGNELFRAGRLFEALTSYAEGLESDPTNAVLLCNRAACRWKLGQWEKAVEDCDAALRAQPNYTKARLRRASCLTKLERWEDALQDYETLKRELPDNADVDRALFDVQVAVKKSRGEEIRGMKFGGDVEEVTSEEQFREAIGSAGLSVVEFITRWSYRCQELSPFIDDLCRRHPCVNFVKVDIEDLPYLVTIESIAFIPTFKIYKDGQKLKELIGPTQQSLEYAVRHYSL